MSAWPVYVALAATVIVQEEVAPLAGGLAAHHGHAEFWLAALACAVGTWSGDLALYWLGRGGGRGRLASLGPIPRALDYVRRHRRMAPLAVRFAYGLRFSLPVACGAARLPFAPYLAWVGLSAAAWSLAFTAAGWLAGALALRVFRGAEHYELPAIAVVAVVGLALWLRRRINLRDKHPGPAVADA